LSPVALLNEVWRGEPHEFSLQTELLTMLQLTTQDPAKERSDHQIGFATWIRSMSFQEMKRDAAVLLNEIVIFAFRIFGH
jgi:hypothetical protein